LAPSMASHRMARRQDSNKRGILASCAKPVFAATSEWAETRKTRFLATIIVDARGPFEPGAMVGRMLSSGRFDST
jgi:hypothetical protein